jgi:nucleoside-diphosphate-sugar epimerase
MHILLTGSSSNVGSGVLLHLLASGHNVTALDIIPLPASIRSQLPADTLDRLTTHILDLTDYHALERIFDSATFDGVIHLCAIPHPKGSDPRLVHNNNIVTSYNVLCTAAMRGVRRIVQASSVNAIGLSYTPEGHQRFDALPLTEEAPFREASGACIELNNTFAHYT